ncbi:hypothetical protein KDM41_12315 [bacterium]|nr:hypothetical protein [bacterium]
MPTAIRYDAANRISYVTITDPFTFEDLHQVLVDLTSPTDHPPDADAIWDGRDVDFRPIDRAFTEEVVGLRERFPARGRARVAFVVPNDLGFGMARMFEALSADVLGESFVCRSVEEAESWILGRRASG